MAVTIQREPENYIRVYDTNTAYYKLYGSQYNKINHNILIGIYDGASLLTTLNLLCPNFLRSRERFILLFIKGI